MIHFRWERWSRSLKSSNLAVLPCEQDAHPEPDRGDVIIKDTHGSWFQLVNPEDI
jgi:hypothetical protein